jgi:hypothetical protein
MAQNDKPPNTIENITDNRGIITQGQVGNNTIIQGGYRTVSPEQRRRMVAAANSSTTKTAVEINSPMGCDECAGLGVQFAQILSEAGWSATPSPNNMWPFRLLGIQIWVHDINAPPPEAITLKAVFTSAGIDVPLQQNGLFRGSFCLYVGPPQ